MQNNVEYLPNVVGDISEVIESNRQSGWPDISAQAKVFVHAYAEAGNFPSACKKVGVGREKGSRILRDPIVSAYLDDLQKDLIDHTIINKQFVELAMLETYEKLSGMVEVPNVTKEGDVVYACRFNGAGVVSLLKEMKSLAGMNKEQGVNGHGVTVQINLGDAGYDEKHIGVTVEGEVLNGSD